MVWEWHSDWAWLRMSVVMLVFWVLAAWIVVTLVRQGKSGGSGSRNAREILDGRYARGGIDDEDLWRSEFIGS